MWRSKIKTAAAAAATRLEEKSVQRRRKERQKGPKQPVKIRYFTIVQRTMYIQVSQISSSSSRGDANKQYTIKIIK